MWQLQETKLSMKLQHSWLEVYPAKTYHDSETFQVTLCQITGGKKSQMLTRSCLPDLPDIHKITPNLFSYFTKLHTKRFLQMHPTFLKQIQRSSSESPLPDLRNLPDHSRQISQTLCQITAVEPSRQPPDQTCQCPRHPQPHCGSPNFILPNIP